MAEAAVEDRPNQRFYCHMCNVQFENASANFTCPHCSNGFIEALEANADNPEDIVEDSDEEVFGMDLDFLMSPVPPEGRRSSRNIRLSQDSRGRRRYASVHPRYRIIRPRTLTRLASSNLRQHTPFENLIHDFVINLGVGVNWGTTGNMQLFLGNPGDYAWGREGLDAIVTQLLNQMDSTGPPPLAKDVIDALPMTEVSEEQVESKLQCSVCWEDFVLKESVRQLPCMHIYHEPCIRPWLELHGTCPICRQNLGNNEQQSNNDGNQDSGGAAGGGNPFNTLQQLFQVVQNSGNSTSTSSSSSSSDTSATNSSRSSSSHSDSMI